MDDIATPIPTISNPQTKKFPIFTAISILTLCLFVAVAAFWAGKQSVQNNGSKASIFQSPTNTPAEISFAYPKFAYLSENEIWTRSSTDNPKQLTFTNNSIDQFDFDPQEDAVAYVLNKKTVNESNYVLFHPQSVHLVKNGSDTEVFSYPPTQSTVNPELSYEIKSLAFSNNGSQLAITTSDSIRLYNIATKQLSTLHTQGMDGQTRVFSLRNPIFSPDDSKLLFTLGYYEGGSQSVIDLTTKKVTALGNNFYGEGTEYLGWEGSNLYGRTFGETTTSSSVSGYDLANQKPFSIFESTNSEVVRAVPQVGQFIFSEVQRDPSGYGIHHLSRILPAKGMRRGQIEIPEYIAKIQPTSNPDLFFVSDSKNIYLLVSEPPVEQTNKQVSRFELSFITSGTL